MNRFAVSALTRLLGADTAVGRHSPAAFDRSNPIIVQGTVEVFKWTNPHSWLFMQVPDDRAALQKWSLEGG